MEIRSYVDRKLNHKKRIKRKNKQLKIYADIAYCQTIEIENGKLHIYEHGDSDSTYAISIICIKDIHVCISRPLLFFECTVKYNLHCIVRKQCYCAKSQHDIDYPILKYTCIIS